MISETKLDSVLSELRAELDRIDQAILVFEKLALEKRTSRERPSRQRSAKLKHLPARTDSHHPLTPAS